MCIAILKPKDKIIQEECLRTCFNSNPDGCGYAYCEDNKIYIKKFMKFENFITSYKQDENKSNMLIHFRICTHGGVSLENTHPFKLNNRMVLIHNGMISGYGERGNGISDTRDFINKVIGNISWKMWKNTSFRQLVKDAIGYSKLAILDVTGEYFIVNEQAGVWDDGVWYSNTSYKPKVSKYTSYTHNKTKDIVKDNKEDKNEDDEKSIKIICRCEGCQEEFLAPERYNMYDKCPKCGSFYTEDIGWVYDGVRYYYDDCYKTYGGKY